MECRRRERRSHCVAACRSRSDSSARFGGACLNSTGQSELGASAPAGYGLHHGDAQDHARAQPAIYLELHATTPPFHGRHLLVLKQKAALAIALGELPGDRITEYYGGSGSGESCPLCKRAIDETQTSAEVDLRSRVFVMHSDCFEAWQQAVAERLEARRPD